MLFLRNRLKHANIGRLKYKDWIRYTGQILIKRKAVVSENYTLRQKAYIKSHCLMIKIVNKLGSCAPNKINSKDIKAKRMSRNV